MMTGTGVLLFLHGGMIMSWLYAFVSFLTLALVGRSLPFAYALACFALAALITRFSSGRLLRNYLVLMLHTAGMVVVLGASVHHVCYPSYGLLSPAWMRALWAPHGNREWAVLAFLACSVIAYWAGGRSLARAEITHGKACARFDVGLGVFFFLFLIESAVPGGSEIAGASAVYSLFSFLLLGILCIGVSLAALGGSRRYSSRHRVAGVVSSFSASVILVAASAMLFFLPAFERAARFGYRVLEGPSRLAVAGLVHVVRFLAGFRRFPPASPPSGDMGSVDYHAIPTTWLGRVLWYATRWGLEAAIVVMIAGAALLLAFLIGRWLLRRAKAIAADTGDSPGKASLWSLLARLLLSLFVLLRHRIGHWPEDRPDAPVLYRRLLKWGARSGLPARIADTPAQYGARLCASYPGMEGRVGSIIDTFNRAVYGDMAPEEAELESAGSALRALRSPRYWPRRLKTRIMAAGSGPQVEGRNFFA